MSVGVWAVWEIIIINRQTDRGMRTGIGKADEGIGTGFRLALYTSPTVAYGIWERSKRAVIQWHIRSCEAEVGLAHRLAKRYHHHGYQCRAKYYQHKCFTSTVHGCRYVLIDQYLMRPKQPRKPRVR